VPLELGTRGGISLRVATTRFTNYRFGGAANDSLDRDRPAAVMAASSTNGTGTVSESSQSPNEQPLKASVKDSTEKPSAAPQSGADVLAMAEEAEAEAAEAEALAVAARARARAIRLRREAAAADSDKPDDSVAAPETEAGPTDETTEDDGDAVDEDGTDGSTAEVVADEPVADEPVADEPARSKRRWRRLPNRAAVIVGVAVLVVAALLGASGYMLWRHHAAAQERQRSAEFAAAARQGVVTLLSMDFNHAKADVQRVVDNSTGAFKDEFASRAGDFTDVVQQSKVVTTGTVNATAVESMAGDSAEVLVSAASQVTNAAGAKQDPRSFRLIVGVARDGGQLKMSKVEFVP
jgi:Mce-associated membrane protein